MLSAIAARKAAHAAKQQQSKSHTDASEASNMTWRETSTPMLTFKLQKSPGFPVTSDSEAAIPRKRKPERLDILQKVVQKKKKRLTKGDMGRTRYFEAEQPLEGFDDDVLGSEAAHYSRPPSSSPSESVLNSTEEGGLISGFVTEDPGPSRRFSPSRPILDSSEEESGELGNEKHYSPEKNIETSFIVSLKASSRLFSPRLDSNCFRLTTDDLKNLDISLDADSATGTLILLPPGHSLTFVGAASITLLQGVIMVLGTLLRPSLHSHRVFSPRCSPLASIESLDIGSDGQESDSPTRSNGRRLPHRIRNAANAADSIVIIQPLTSGVEGLGKVCRIFDGVFDVGLGVRESQAEDAIGVGGFHLVNSHSSPHPQLQPFLMPESWKKALDSVVPSFPSPDVLESSSESRSFVALIKGSKKCGKSTFARTLLNRLTTRYRRVAFLECDLGQSEFTPGGMVALHVISRPVFGPPFTHPTIPHRAHYIGHSTPRSNPSHYLACIQALVQTYRMDVQYAYQETLSNVYVSDKENSLKESDDRSETCVPLVVNTQGWIKGLGGDLLRKIEEIVDATDVFDLDAQSASYPPQHNLRVHSSSTRLHTIQPILSSSLMSYYTPADYRSLSILSYFHSLFPGRGREGRSWSTEFPLCARAPWEVNCKEAIHRFVLVGAGFEDVVPEELDCVLNCSLVALVCEEDPALDPSVAPELESSESPWSYTRGAPVPSPNISHCLGLALIRGVNAATRALHLLTPVSHTEFPKCRVFVKGELELPVWGMLDFREGQTEGVAGIKWGKVPYLQMGGRKAGTIGGAIGGARRRVRKNLMRRGQL